ncbi:hypothetical protein HO173_013247 [Letharia columbiana]|uniref:Uncharacterized protein n=1 Tax=Letharia columbiana TaxID=112416 RepID=A0A8H6CGM4_9LECA|nr:uncharacterized protein HO173_013247 [Letharia columbiana]KAF6223172.1 hypothetical protein HO173_013247 [Letharia columbiana]
MELNHQQRRWLIKQRADEPQTRQDSMEYFLRQILHLSQPIPPPSTLSSLEPRTDTMKRRLWYLQQCIFLLYLLPISSEQWFYCNDRIRPLLRRYQLDTLDLNVTGAEETEAAVYKHMKQRMLGPRPWISQDPNVEDFRYSCFASEATHFSSTESLSRTTDEDSDVTPGRKMTWCDNAISKGLDQRKRKRVD